MAVRFDAATDRITWTGTAPTPSSGLTITFWAYVSVDRDDFSTMVRLHSSTGATTNLNVAMDSSGTLPSVFTAGGTSTGPQAVSVGSWARLAVTITGTTSTVYVALGAAGATQSAVGTVGSNAAVSPNSGYTVGGRSAVDGSEWYNGRLAYLRIWSTVLTQAEIETEWASPTPVHTSLLFADYPLLLASDLTDHSGNARHLVAGSTAVTTEGDPPVNTTIPATLAATMPPLAASVAGSAVAAGQLTADLPPLATSTTGGTTTDGHLAATLPAIESAATGGVALDGHLAAALPVIWSTTAGDTTTAGQLGGALPPLDTELAGTAALAGTITAALPSPVAALGGSVAVPVTAVLAMTLPGLTMASGRVSWPPAVSNAPDNLIDVDGPIEVPWVAVS